jgi:Protein of unknown function (DUF968).
MEEVKGKTLLGVATSLSKEDILKYANNQGLFAVIKFWDSRRITKEQRKKIFATIYDIADYFGDPRELVRYDLTSSYCAETGQEFFSLSDCSLETAREFISYIIEYVIEHDIPLTDLGINRVEEIDKYLYQCIKHKKCCICGKEGTVYTLDRDKNKMCLCLNHYDEAKLKGLKKFGELYKVYGIKVKEDKEQ